MQQRSVAASRPSESGGPVVLVHGFASSPRVMAPLARHLASALGREVVRVSVSSRHDLRGSAFDVYRKVQELAAKPESEHVDLVGHSMGGLIASYVLKAIDRGRRVRSVVTLGTPHGGARAARLADLALGGSSRALGQMQPGSGVLHELRSLPVPPGSELISVAGGRDWLVPEASARLAPEPGQCNLWLPEAGHTSFLIHRSVFRLVGRVLAEEPHDASRARRVAWSELAPAVAV